MIYKIDKQLILESMLGGAIIGGGLGYLTGETLGSGDADPLAGASIGLGLGATAGNMKTEYDDGKKGTPMNNIRLMDRVVSGFAAAAPAALTGAVLTLGEDPIDIDPATAIVAGGTAGVIASNVASAGARKLGRLQNTKG